MRILGAIALAWLVLGVGCSSAQPVTELTYMCDTSPALSPQTVPGQACAADDPQLSGLEPSLPSEADVCQTLVADKFASDSQPPDEASLDTVRIQQALTACTGKVVKLVTGGSNNAFVAASLNISSVKLWIDQGVTLYASRNPDLFRMSAGDHCGVYGVNDSGACNDFIVVGGTNPAILGDGTIDGQGGEPLIGHDYSWWQLSYALRDVDGSLGNPTLIKLATGTTGFVLYRINLHNSPKFHVKLTSNPPGGVCDSTGKGFIVWGITLLTPSKWTNSVGQVLTPSFARNTDGVDPGAGSAASCGLIACNTISTGDDNIAIKGGSWVSDLIIAHNHFGTGHGMSIGSETYGAGSGADPDKTMHRGVQNVLIYDLTIDADSRPVGADANAADFNGIRIKSDESRGGVVNDITYRDVCMRDMTNAILVSAAYNPLFAGTSYPDFQKLSFENVRHVSCKSLRQPVVTLNGFNAAYRAGPIQLDNVVIDNIGPQGVSAQFADISIGPRSANFSPSGLGVSLANGVNAPSTPKQCVFPKLPAPQPPPGWVW